MVYNGPNQKVVVADRTSLVVVYLDRFQVAARTDEVVPCRLMDIRLISKIVIYDA